MEKLDVETVLRKLINELLLKSHDLTCDVVTVMSDQNDARYAIVINVDLYKSYPLFESFDKNYSLSFTSAKFDKDLLKILKYINLTEWDVLSPVIFKFNDRRAIDLLNEDIKKSLDEIISEGYDCFKEFYFGTQSEELHNYVHPFVVKRLKEVYGDEYGLLSFYKTLKLIVTLKRCSKSHSLLFKRIEQSNDNLIHRLILEKGE